ncbi:hypothetical protein D3C85_1488320 [compost metagenome]
MQNTDLDPFLTPNALNGGCSSIPGGSTKNMNNFILFLRDIRIELTHKLKGYILKSKGRTMEQLQNIQRIVKFLNWRNLRCTEAGIAPLDHRLKIFGRNLIINVIGENLLEQLLIAKGLPFL